MQYIVFFNFFCTKLWKPFMYVIQLSFSVLCFFIVFIHNLLYHSSSILHLNILVHVFWWMYYTFHLDIYLGMEWLGHRVSYTQPYSDFSVFQSGYTKSCYYQQCKESSNCSTSLSVLGIFVIAILVSHCGFDLLFPDKVENHFKCFLAIQVVSFGVVSVYLFAHFCIGLSAFFLLICCWSLCILDLSSFSDGYLISEYFTIFSSRSFLFSLLYFDQLSICIGFSIWMSN